MKYILFTLTFLASFPALCQDKDSTKYKRTRVCFQYSPDYCYRILNYPSSHKWVQDLRNGEEVPIYGYSTGLGFRIILNKKFLMETGLLYAVKGVQTKKTRLDWTGPGEIYPNNGKKKLQHAFMEIPLKLNYGLGGKKIRYFASAGISLNTLAQKKTTIGLEFMDGRKLSESSVRSADYFRINVAALIGFGFQSELTERMSISVEPVFRQFLNSIDVGQNSKEYPYTVGVNVGLYFGLKKKQKANKGKVV